MVFEFTIIEDGPHYGRKMWKEMAPIKPYPPSGGKATWVYRIASALAGHSITREEADRFGTSDVNGFIHRQVRMTLSETAPKENGKRYNNIDSFLSVKKELPLFDEKKVPKDNQAEKVADINQPESAEERARAFANSLPGGKDAGAKETSGAEDLNVEDIPF